MNNLPQELVDHISSHLPRDDLKNTLFLSHKFQCAAEQFSGAFSEFTLTSDNASRFLATFSGRHFRYLRRISFATCHSDLLSESGPDCGDLDDADLFEEDCRYTESELELLDQDFTRQINFLFSTLEKMEMHTKDKYGPGNIHLTITTPSRMVDDCIHRRFTSWRVHLLSPTTLPLLESVRSLRVETPYERSTFQGEGPTLTLRQLDLRVLVDLAGRCPRLDSMDCQLGAAEWYYSFETEACMRIAHDWEGPRRDSRHDFAKALESAAPLETLPCLRHVQLDLLYPLRAVEQIDQRLALPNLTKPALYDPLSSSLRLLSSQLRSMNLRMVADESLFWPTDGSTPSWPNLESLNVMFHMATPSGSWYFHGLPGVGATEGFEVTTQSYPPFLPSSQDYDDHEQVEHIDWAEEEATVQFRVEPNEKTLVPFLKAFAKAASRMFSLKEAALWSPLSFDVSQLKSGPYENFDQTEAFSVVAPNPDAHDDLAWGIAYTAPGAKAFSKYPGEDFSPKRQIWWKVAKWRPYDELHRLFQNIGSFHDTGLIEHWNGSHAGEGLAMRDDFVSWEGQRWCID